MVRYQHFGLTIDSELDLGEVVTVLSANEGSPPDVLIHYGPVIRPQRKASLNEEWAFNRQVGTFFIKNGNEITIDPVPDASQDLLQVFITGRIMAFLLRQRGWLPLHASGVMLGKRAV